MRKRLENLRDKLDVQWKDLAVLLGISVPMLGCIRRGERNPSAKFIARVDALERNGVALQPKHSDGNKLHAITVAESAMEYRIVPPSVPPSPREHVTQCVLSALDLALKLNKSDQFETLIMHLLGVITGGESYDWHRREISNIIDEHFRNK